MSHALEFFERSFACTQDDNAFGEFCDDRFPSIIFGPVRIRTLPPRAPAHNQPARLPAK
jgi:hypothetical protein